jgi:hypothetical protein
MRHTSVNTAPSLRLPGGRWRCRIGVHPGDESSSFIGSKLSWPATESMVTRGPTAEAWREADVAPGTGKGVWPGEASGRTRGLKMSWPHGAEMLTFTGWCAAISEPGPGEREPGTEGTGVWPGDATSEINGLK